jgi:hypothetical protein
MVRHRSTLLARCQQDFVKRVLHSRVPSTEEKRFGHLLEAIFFAFVFKISLTHDRVTPLARGTGRESGSFTPLTSYVLGFTESDA